MVTAAVALLLLAAAAMVNGALLPSKVTEPPKYSVGTALRYLSKAIYMDALNKNRGMLEKSQVMPLSGKLLAICVGEALLLELCRTRSGPNRPAAAIGLQSTSND